MSTTAAVSKVSQRVRRYQPRTPFDYIGPAELGTVQDLDWALGNHENVVILFYWPTCPYCIDFDPVYRRVAELVHRSNARAGAVQIAMLQMDAKEHRDAIESRRAGMSRPVPKVLFKRRDGKGKLFSARVRTVDTLLNAMADFYDDDGMRPVTNDLDVVMNGNDVADPDFVFFYNDEHLYAPRFAFPYRAMRTEEEGVTDITFMLTQPDAASTALRARGVAISVGRDRLDRPDVPVPSIYDTRTDTFHRGRRAMLWLESKLTPRAAQTPHLSPKKHDCTVRASLVAEDSSVAEENKQ
jgi:thiol-disulfide isomerase/thioredoxin